MAERVKDTLGTIIENRPGAGINIGVDALLAAAPDGLTIGIAAVATHAINLYCTPAPQRNAASRTPRPLSPRCRGVPNWWMNADTARRLNINTLADLIRVSPRPTPPNSTTPAAVTAAQAIWPAKYPRHGGHFALHIPYNGGKPGATGAAQRSGWTSTLTTRHRIQQHQKSASSRRLP
jgi:tripartite-type tricarboxylate transporter receptor subunit TctC